MKILPATLSPEERKKRITTIIVVVVILVLAIVGVLIYIAGKRKGQDQGSIDLSSPLTPDGSAPSASESEIRKIAEDLHRDMDGANVFGHDMEPWSDLLALSDSDFVRVNNEFNTQFQAESGESFRSWVDNEAAANAWYYTKPTVMARFAKLNIK